MTKEEDLYKEFERIRIKHEFLQWEKETKKNGIPKTKKEEYELIDIIERKVMNHKEVKEAYQKWEDCMFIGLPPRTDKFKEIDRTKGLQEGDLILFVEGSGSCDVHTILNPNFNSIENLLDITLMKISHFTQTNIICYPFYKSKYMLNKKRYVDKKEHIYIKYDEELFMKLEKLKDELNFKKSIISEMLRRSFQFEVLN